MQRNDGPGLGGSPIFLPRIFWKKLWKYVKIWSRYALMTVDPEKKTWLSIIWIHFSKRKWPGKLHLWQRKSINEFQKKWLGAKWAISSPETQCKDFCNGESNGQSNVHAECRTRKMDVETRVAWHQVMRMFHEKPWDFSSEVLVPETIPMRPTVTYVSVQAILNCGEHHYSAKEKLFPYLSSSVTVCFGRPVLNRNSNCIHQPIFNPSSTAPSKTSPCRYPPAKYPASTGAVHRRPGEAPGRSPSAGERRLRSRTSGDKPSWPNQKSLKDNHPNRYPS